MYKTQNFFYKFSKSNKVKVIKCNKTDSFVFIILFFILLNEHSFMRLLCV